MRGSLALKKIAPENLKIERNHCLSFPLCALFYCFLGESDEGGVSEFSLGADILTISKSVHKIWIKRSNIIVSNLCLLSLFVWLLAAGWKHSIFIFNLGTELSNMAQWLHM